MAAFLSDAWLDELEAAARAARLPLDLRLTIQQVILGEGGPDVVYAIRIADGTASVTAGAVGDADVTFTQDRTTAEAIARGTLSAQAAFLAGRLRVAGDLRGALQRAGELVDIGDVFAPARTNTTW